MHNLDQNEQEIKKLEEDIRRLGIPYASKEPEPLYWANFRVRVMEQIAEKERKAAWTTRIAEFIAEHIIGTSIAAAAACLMIAGIIATQQSSSSEAPQMAAIQPPAQAAPLSTPATPKVEVPSPVKDAVRPSHQSDRTRPADLAKAEKHETKQAYDLAAVAEPFASAPSEQAVSLESLSQPELEAVLQGLQSNE